LCSPQTLALVANFQTAVVQDLLTRTLAAAQAAGAHTVLVSGGVAANSELRAAFNSKCSSLGFFVHFPSRALSTDNAAMIAAAAYPHFLAGERAGASLEPQANLPLA
jgi:N6-L-threonylcarbamoyladenine synthase